MGWMDGRYTFGVGVVEYSRYGGHSRRYETLWSFFTEIL